MSFLKAYDVDVVSLCYVPDDETGALKTQVLEKASMKQRISQGWKTHVRKMQVQCCVSLL